MSRSGYVEDLDSDIINLYQGRVARAFRGKRGQFFLRELAQQMDAMPNKFLIAGELQNEDGDCCAIGVVCKLRGIDTDRLDYEDPEQVAAAVDIAKCMAAEIAFMNDEWSPRETPEQRWSRMRKWVQSEIREPAAA